MKDADVFHQDVMKLALSSLELLQHNLEEKAKCQKTNREDSYTSNRMRDLIDELKQLVFEQLDSLKREHLKDTETKEAAEQQVSSMNGNQFRREKFAASCRSESDLQRIDELKEWRTRSLQCCRGLDDVSFQPTESNKENVFCRIEGSVVCKNTTQFKPPIPRNSVICGLDILDYELYVASNTDISVFDARSDTLKFIRKFSVKGLVQAQDVKASVKNDCLHIMDGSNGQRNEIFVTDKNGKVLNKWPVENYGNLSITEEGTVVLAVNVSAKIVEYSHDGHLIQKVCLSEARVQNLWHAIKLRGGNFVVSYNQKENQLIDASGTSNEELSEPNRSGISIVDSSGSYS